MNSDQQSIWRNEALDAVFAALASNNTLSGRLIYKGARVLNRRLGGIERQSLDIDMNLTAQFVLDYPNRDTQAIVIRDEITETLKRVFRLDVFPLVFALPAQADEF